jgi:hypothetical protein
MQPSHSLHETDNMLVIPRRLNLTDGQDRSETTEGLEIVAGTTSP